MRVKIRNALFAVLASFCAAGCNKPEDDIVEQKPEKIVLTNEQAELINDKLDLIMMALSRETGRNVTKIRSINFTEDAGITLDVTVSDYNSRRDETVDVDYVISSDDYNEAYMQAWLDQVDALATHYAGNNVAEYTNLIDKQLRTIKTAMDFTYSTTTTRSLDVSSLNSKDVLINLANQLANDNKFDQAAEVMDVLKNNPDYSKELTATYSKIDNAESGFEYLASLLVNIKDTNYFYNFKFSGNETFTEATLTEAIKAYFTGEETSVKAELVEVAVELANRSFVYAEETELIAAAIAFTNDLGKQATDAEVENSIELA